ncbi:DUF4352 domain-containing protein [Enterococcus sp. AZ109]|uniref:DUF4352 domain-containing protein n=1 Tax=Enterococcus sp. AZ109 TaxID=2774634 RepID=UPI003F285DE3
MKKILLSMLAICFLLTGCDMKGANTSSSGDGSAPITEIAVKDGLEVPFTAEGIEMKLSGVSTSESVDENGDAKQLVTFVVEAQNIGTDEKGIGAIDFQLVTDKEETYRVTEEMEAFGGVLEPEESSKGKLYYLIEPGEKPQQLTYTPSDKTLKTWELQ